MVNDLADDADLTAAASESRTPADVAIAVEVAEVFEHMLGDGRSVIDPSATIWTASVAEELRRRIEDNQLIGADAGQWDKLELQLEGAAREVVREC